MQTDGEPWLQSNVQWKLEVVRSVLHSQAHRGRACVMLIPAPAQTTAGFWLGKGCKCNALVIVECKWSLYTSTSGKDLEGAFPVNVFL